MGQRNSNRRQLDREHIAREAARIMLDGGMQDYQLAKRKAAERLRLPSGCKLPSNDEIERAVEEYQRLFRADSQPHRLRDLRIAAAKAMRFLSRFDPCLVGSVVTGTADAHSVVCLHLFSEPPEAVGLFLDESGIPYAIGERRLRWMVDDYERFPTYSFMADDISLELVIFDAGGRRQSPLSPVDGKPMQRVNLARLERLIEPDEPTDHACIE